MIKCYVLKHEASDRHLTFIQNSCYLCRQLSALVKLGSFVYISFQYIFRVYIYFAINRFNKEIRLIGFRILKPWFVHVHLD